MRRQDPKAPNHLCLGEGLHFWWRNVLKSKIETILGPNSKPKKLIGVNWWQKPFEMLEKWWTVKHRIKSSEHSSAFSNPRTSRMGYRQLISFLHCICFLLFFPELWILVTGNPSHAWEETCAMKNNEPLLIMPLLFKNLTLSVPLSMSIYHTLPVLTKTPHVGLHLARPAQLPHWFWYLCKSVPQRLLLALLSGLSWGLGCVDEKRKHDERDMKPLSKKKKWYTGNYVPAV